jgi:hypothetical protein
MQFRESQAKSKFLNTLDIDKPLLSAFYREGRAKKKSKNPEK